MTLKECMFINNSCYIKNEKMNNNKPTGIVVHSTGANNKTLKRYVQPVSGQSYFDAVIADIGKNQYGNHWNQSAEAMKRSVCVHAFIGANAAGKVETYQVLPFDVCCWGVGSGKNGSYNYNPTARVQFEMCEDDLTDETYFNAVMKEAQEFCAYLCKTYGFGIDKISSHHESYVQGYGSNHGDPENWLKPFGKTMDWFRAEVQKLLDVGKTVETPLVEKVLYRVQTGAFTSKANALACSEKVKAAGFATYIVKAGSYYKVQVGAYEVKANADATAKKLKAAGFSTYITTKGGTAVSDAPMPVVEKVIEQNSRVTINKGAKVYGKSYGFRSWVYPEVWIVHSRSGDRVVVNKNVKGNYSIMSPVNVKDLTLVE